MTDKVVLAKEALMVAVGDNWQRYLTNMKLWFRHKWTKEEFDYECRKLLSLDKIHLHNQFLLAVLNKVEAFSAPQNNLMYQESTLSSVQQQAGSGRSGGGSSSSSRKRKRSSRSYYERVTFEPYDLLEYIPEDNMQLIRPPPSSEQSLNQNLPTQRFCVQELFLPDAGFIMGRFLIGAWETGLVSVEDDVAEYITLAVQVFLKNLISALIMNRKSYRTTSDGNFYYDVGASPHDPSLRNTVTRQKVDDAPLELDKDFSANFMRRPNDDNAFLSACEEIVPSERVIISLKDCQQVFRDRNLVPSHSIYAINMERINMMMH